MPTVLYQEGRCRRGCGCVTTQVGNNEHLQVTSHHPHGNEKAQPMCVSKMIPAVGGGRHNRVSPCPGISMFLPCFYAPMLPHCMSHSMTLQGSACLLQPCTLMSKRKQIAVQNTK